MGGRKTHVSPCPLETDVKRVSPVIGSRLTSLHCPQLGPSKPLKQSHRPPAPERHTPRPQQGTIGLPRSPVGHGVSTIGQSASQHRSLPAS
eukprot:416132-Prorocentrum_minimum.AAC.2